MKMNAPSFSVTFLSPSTKYMEGGIASGFRHVKPEEYEPRLLHVKKQAKGKNMCVKQLPVAIESLNQGDAFILDCVLLCAPFAG
jgi:gelsolin